MSTEIILNENSELVSKLVLEGDLSKMTAAQKVQYYNSFCTSLGLNPLTQPFQLITFQGKQRMYASKDCTDQLRKIHGVSITDVTAIELKGVYVVTAKAKDKDGKTDCSTGVVTVEGLKGDALANALMKAETKAKRRVTLSICGLGILDESETETMPGAKTEDVPHEIVKSNGNGKAQHIAEESYTPFQDEGKWIAKLEVCKKQADVLALYKANQITVDAHPEIQKLFKERQTILSTPKKQTA